MALLTRKPPVDPPTTDVLGLARLQDHEACLPHVEHKQGIVERQQRLATSLVDAQQQVTMLDHAETVRMSKPGASLDEGADLKNAKRTVREIQDTLARLDDALSQVNRDLQDAYNHARTAVEMAARAAVLEPLLGIAAGLRQTLVHYEKLAIINGQASRLCGFPVYSHLCDPHMATRIKAYQETADEIKRVLSVLGGGYAA